MFFNHIKKIAGIDSAQTTSFLDQDYRFGGYKE